MLAMLLLLLVLLTPGCIAFARVDGFLLYILSTSTLFALSCHRLLGSLFCGVAGTESAICVTHLRRCSRLEFFLSL